MSPRTIAFLLLLLAGVLALGGWLVVGPALATRTPVAAEPPIDLDGPKLAASPRQASASTARAIVVASASASASAASGGADDKARCGEDQLPVYRLPEPDADGRMHVSEVVVDADGFRRFVLAEARPGDVGYTGAMRRIDAALRASGDSFDRAVADALNVDDLRSPRERLATLVRDAAASHDPRVESLALTACGQSTFVNEAGQPAAPGSAICAALDVRRWAQDDPGNGVPWLYALQQADQAGDPAAQREALLHLASATRFVTHAGMASAAIARVRLASDADLAAQLTLAQQAIPLELGPPYPPLTSRCSNQAGGDSAMAAACDLIASRMMDGTDSIMSRAVGGSIHKLATGDASLLDKIHREMGDYGKRMGAQLDDEMSCSNERKMLRHFAQVGEHGEVALMKDVSTASTPR